MPYSKRGRIAAGASIDSDRSADPQSIPSSTPNDTGHAETESVKHPKDTSKTPTKRFPKRFTIQCTRCGASRRVTESQMSKIKSGASTGLCQPCGYQLYWQDHRKPNAPAPPPKPKVFGPCGAQITKMHDPRAGETKRCASFYECQEANPRWYWICLGYAADHQWHGWQFTDKKGGE